MMNLDFQQILTQLVGFLALLCILKLFFWKPVLSMLDERKEKIRRQFKEIEDTKAELTQLKSEYEAKLSAIEEASRARINEAILEGQRIAQGLKDDAHKEAQKIIKDAKSYINDEFLKAKDELKNSVVALAIDAASHIIESQIAESDSRRIVQDFIKEIEGVDERKDISG